MLPHELNPDNCPDLTPVTEDNAVCLLEEHDMTQDCNVYGCDKAAWYKLSIGGGNFVTELLLCLSHAKDLQRQFNNKVI